MPFEKFRPQKMLPYVDHPLGLFLLAMLVCTALEYFVIEELFGTVCWDHSDTLLSGILALLAFPVRPEGGLTEGAARRPAAAADRPPVGRLVDRLV